MTPRLPLETSEAIIDHLDFHEDRKSLYACSLACKAWIPKCRSHIFSTISIYSHWHNNPKILSNLLSVLRSSTQPGRYVRDLTIYMNHDEIPRGDSTNGLPELPILAEKLTHVQTLEIYDMEWDRLDAAGKTAIISGFQTVEQFVLERGVYTFTQATELITSFPSLDCLVCYYWGVTSRYEDLPHMAPPPPLSELVVEGCDAWMVIPWLLTVECHVSYVELSIRDEEVQPACVELLRGLGPSLEILTLCLYNAEVDLSQNISLSYLRIHCGSFRLIGGSELDQDVYLNLILQVLSQIRANRLKEVVLDVHYIKDYHLDSHVWSDIEHILMHPRFSRLRNLTFDINSEGVSGSSELKDCVRERMPNLSARDIIDFLVE